MKTKLLIGFIVIVILAGAEYVLSKQQKSSSSVSIASADYKNGTYSIDGTAVTLKDGTAEREAVPGSASKITTKYFGNEVKADFNKDGKEDVAFLLTESGAGSGTFYYLVAALKNNNGFEGTNAVLIGDRIAPQTTEWNGSSIMVNYADRKQGEPMSATPSVGVSKSFKIQNGVLVDSEKTAPPVVKGESGITGKVLLGPHCPVVQNPPEPQCADTPYSANLAIVAPDGSKVFKEFKSDQTGNFVVNIPPGTYAIRSAGITHTLPYCSSSESIVVTQDMFASTTITCDTGIR